MLQISKSHQKDMINELQGKKNQDCLKKKKSVVHGACHVTEKLLTSTLPNCH